MLIGFTQSTFNFTSADTVTFRSPDLPCNNGVSSSNNNNNNKKKKKKKKNNNKQIANADSVSNLMR